MRSVSSQVSLHRPNPATMWAWMVALVPTAPYLGALALVTATRGAIALPIFLLLIGVGVAASVAAAVADRKELLSRGFDDLVDARWAVVPVAYLWKRADAFRGTYFVNTPLWAHVVALPFAVVTFSVWSNFVMRTG